MDLIYTKLDNGLRLVPIGDTCAGAGTAKPSNQGYASIPVIFYPSSNVFEKELEIETLGNLRAPERYFVPNRLLLVPERVITCGQTSHNLLSNES